ncbi:MAG: hypothetical protein FJ267_10895 [Planctomycetes bacterium]|nr:hypothetical protein [Planctomycetota bacterium]
MTTTSGLNDFAEKVEAIYEQQLRAILEPNHTNEFVAIDPESQQYFLGKSIGESAAAARTKLGTRMTHMIKVSPKWNGEGCPR